jgi:hypothetical protein
MRISVSFKEKEGEIGNKHKKMKKRIVVPLFCRDE